MKRHFIKLIILIVSITCVGCSKPIDSSINTQKDKFEKDLIEFIQKSVDYEDRLNEFLFDVDKVILKNTSTTEEGKLLLNGHSEAEGSYLDILENEKTRIQNNTIDSKYKDVLDKTINFEKTLIDYYNSTSKQLMNNNDSNIDTKSIEEKLEKEKADILKMVEGFTE